MAENNTKVMRDALLKVSSSLCPACRRRNCKGCPRAVAEFMPAVRKALALPMRQCDVGTAEEQTDRFAAFCASVHPSCVACKADGQYTRCEFVWAQMPYEEGGAK